MSRWTCSGGHQSRRTGPGGHQREGCGHVRADNRSGGHVRADTISKKAGNSKGGRGGHVRATTRNKGEPAHKRRRRKRGQGEILRKIRPPDIHQRPGLLFKNLQLSTVLTRKLGRIPLAKNPFVKFTGKNLVKSGPLARFSLFKSSCQEQSAIFWYGFFY